MCFGHFLHMQFEFSISLSCVFLLSRYFEVRHIKLSLNLRDVHHKSLRGPHLPGSGWRDDAEWKQYDAATAAAILQGLTDRANRVELGPLVSYKHPRGAQYVADLSTMMQINVVTGFTRDVKVVKAPAAVVPAPPVNAWENLALVTEEVRACQCEMIKSLKETVMSLKEVSYCPWWSKIK